MTELDDLLARDCETLALDVAVGLCARSSSVYRSRGPQPTAELCLALLTALRGDLVDGGGKQLRATLPGALARLTREPVSFRDLRHLGDGLRTGLRAAARAAGLTAEPLAPLEPWFCEFAYQIGLHLLSQREDLIVRQAGEIEVKLAEQRELNRLVGELRDEVREARQLGQYTLLSKLGEGGMGVVYRARHALMRRPTAVKLMSPERTRGEDLIRFEREVRLTARLSHPNTVTIYDFGRTPEGLFYYAMELLEGGTLEDIVMVDGPQRPARVAHVMHMILGALAEAHDIGLIHRDIKPANIMLCEKGGELDVAKILDFGLVKEARAEVGASLTQDSQITGTPYYMAPEMIVDPRNVDARADLYALGAVGYYFLTGRNVFEGRNHIEVLSHHLRSEPTPPSRRGVLVSPALEACIMACLRKDPAQRPASAAALRSQLRACVTAEPWEPEGARAWWSRHGDAVRERRAVSDDPAGAHTVDIALRVVHS